jgi:hypothetical protein
MAITYPTTTPTSIGIANIQLRQSQVVSRSTSPFSFKEQVIVHTGERWGASVSLPPCRKDTAEPWVAFLMAQRGGVGTFLLGDPNMVTPQGTATSATISGSAGDRSVSVTMTGTLKAGDYIQLGSGSSSRLHKVLVDKNGSGTLEIWPSLRTDYTSASATLNDTKGVFRLTSPELSWDINDISAYGIMFTCSEVV